MKITRQNETLQKVLHLLPWLIIFVGAVTRIIVWFQNRNLFIDEANVARNIYERNLAGLARPLSYEQYAPPVFLWITKISASLFGYSEMALRVMPILSGIGALIMLFYLLRECTSYKALWYPLALMAVSYILIRYSSELKQYMTDAFVVLSLMVLALKTDLLQLSAKKFTLIWFLVGSLAIWASMPSVFALAGIGCYYLFLCLQAKNYQKIYPLAIVAVLWVAQFVFYYLAILKPQADSSYLQNFHQGYFMFLIPTDKAKLMHNWYLFRTLLQETSGYAGLSWKVNTGLFLLGAIALLRKQTARGLLVIVPILAVFLAAGLHQYSLIPRVGIFIMPLILVLIGCGFSTLMSIRFIPLQLLLVFFGIRAINDHSMLRPMIKEPYQFENLTEEFEFLQEHHLSGSQIYMHYGVVPAYKYYTEIHPARNKWAAMKGAHPVSWDVNRDSLAQQVARPVAFIYTSISKEELDTWKNDFGRHLAIDTFIEDETRRCFVYIYK